MWPHRHPFQLEDRCRRPSTPYYEAEEILDLCDQGLLELGILTLGWDPILKRLRALIAAEEGREAS